MVDIVRSDNPIIDSATTLDNEALKPAVTSVDKLATAYPGIKPPATDTTNTPKRRGRPPGSKNKKTLEREKSTVTPPTRDFRTGADILTSRQASQKREEEKQKIPPGELKVIKKNETEVLADTIASELNEKIAMALIMMGAPQYLVYKEGQAPKVFKKDSPYADAISPLLIDEGTASIWARFAVELKHTSVGEKITSGEGNGNSTISLILYGVLSVLTGAQYVRGLAEFYKQFAPFMEAYKQAQQAQEQTTNQGVENG